MLMTGRINSWKLLKIETKLSLPPPTTFPVASVKKMVKVIKSSPESYDIIVSNYDTGKIALVKELPERPLASFTCLFPRRCTCS